METIEINDSTDLKNIKSYEGRLPDILYFAEDLLGKESTVGFYIKIDILPLDLQDSIKEILYVKGLDIHISH